MVSESRYLIPEGPPVPIPNTEVKLRRAEDTLPATARENRSAPTFGFCLQRRTKKHKRDGAVERRFDPKQRKRIKSIGFFPIRSSAFSPLDLVLSEYEVHLRNEIKGSASEAICQIHPERGCSSVGRAPALQAGGHGFESHHLHQSGHRRRSITWACSSAG